MSLTFEQDILSIVVNNEEQSYLDLTEPDRVTCPNDATCECGMSDCKARRMEYCDVDQSKCDGKCNPSECCCKRESMIYFVVLDIRVSLQMAVI